MRFASLIFALFLLCSCASSDAVSDRQHGQLMVCHEGRSLAVSNAGMFAHEQHGDAIGPCPDRG